MNRDYLFDLAKIIEGAANGDSEKVVAYSKSLGDRLASHGETAAAKRVRQILGKSSAGKLTLARTNQTANLPVDSESRIPVADEEHPQLDEVTVYLPDEAQQTVSRFLRYFRAAGQLVANGVGISPSLLIYGPPGCGKTQLARLIAAELGYPLITARSDSLISSYLGSTAKNLRSLFEHASARPCVLFLDEFDAIAKMRDDDRELGELKRIVISLMQNIDAMGRDHVLIAATNHQHLLDPAIWRRFAHKLNLREPDQACRQLMWKHFLGRFGDDDLVEIGAALSDGMTGAQIRDIADDAVRNAVLDNRKTIDHRDLLINLSGSQQLAGQIAVVHKAMPKLTQKRIADLFGITQGYVSQLLKQGADNAD